MSEPDIDLLIRLRRRIPRVRELAKKHPDDADELDLLAYDFEHLWLMTRKALGRVAQLETTPGGASLAQPVGARETFEAQDYERLRRPSSVVSVMIEGVASDDVRIEPPIDVDTTYTEIRKKR